MSTTPEVGKTYRISSLRKGAFTGIVTRLDDTWADILVVSGRARAMLPYNEREAGEAVTVRLSFSTFTEVPA
jgi:hypothetical protein